MFFTKKNLIALLILFLAVVLYTYANYCGLGLTYDSKDYLYAAETFAKNLELRNADNGLYVERSPIFPVFLSFLGQNRLFLSLYVNGLFLFFSLWLLYQVSSKLFQSNSILYLFLLSQSFSIAHLLTHSFLWSEPLFLILLTLSLIYLYQYFENYNSKYLVYMFFLSFVFALERNTGIFFIAGMALSIFLLSSKKVFLHHSIVYFILSSSGWIIWTVRSILTKGSDFHPAKEAMFQNFFINIYHYSNVLSAWLLPLSLPYIFRLIILILLITFSAYFFWENSKKIQKSQLLFIKSLVVIYGVYTLALLSLENVGYHESERYFAIVYPAFFILIFIALEILYLKIRTKSYKKILILIMTLWLVYPLWRTGKNVKFWHDHRCQNKKSAQLFPKP